MNTLVTLPETNIAPENGWLEYCFLLGRLIFRGELLVSGRVFGLSILFVFGFVKEILLPTPNIFRLQPLVFGIVYIPNHNNP